MLIPMPDRSAVPRAAARRRPPRRQAEGANGGACGKRTRPRGPRRDSMLRQLRRACRAPAVPARVVAMRASYPCAGWLVARGGRASVSSRRRNFLGVGSRSGGAGCAPPDSRMTAARSGTCAQGRRGERCPARRCPALYTAATRRRVCAHDVVKALSAPSTHARCGAGTVPLPALPADTALLVAASRGLTQGGGARATRPPHRALQCARPRRRIGRRQLDAHACTDARNRAHADAVP